MLPASDPPTPPALAAVAADFLETEGPNLLARWRRHQEFWDQRLASGLEPCCRVATTRIGPVGEALNRADERFAGVNFAAQDYLSLSSHPLVRAAVTEAAARWGVHGGGSVVLQGGTPPLRELEDRLADLFCAREATVFPTGWAAGYGAVRCLVREEDHVILDNLAHAGLQEAAAGATRHVHRVPHCSHEAVRRRLLAIRAAHPQAGILVVTESLFPMDSTVPDLRALQTVCRVHGATLLVDAAHDFGALGCGGLGFIGDQGLLGEVDVVVGSFSKTFASNGGFVLSRAHGLRQALRFFAGPLTFSSALSPVQAAAVLAALDIVVSPEGAQRRRRLMANVLRLREGLAARAFSLRGQPSPIVPVEFASLAEGRLVAGAALRLGALVNLAEHPAVPRGTARLRLQVMADHTPQQVDRMVEVAVAARDHVAAETIAAVG